MRQGDYRVTVTIRNARLARAIEAAGYDTVAELSRACGVAEGAIGQMLSLKNPPVGSRGTIRPQVEKVAMFLGEMAEDLFPPEFMARALAQNSVTMDVDKPGIAAIMHQAQATPERYLALDDVQAAVRRGLDTLTPRERLVVSLKYGIEDGREWTLEEIGRHPQSGKAKSKERVRQVLFKAERKMKHPSRAAPLREALRTLEEEG